MRNKVEIIVFLVFIAFFGLGYLVIEQREFSEMENRYLEQCPKFTWNSFVNGEFTEKFETYTADQIAGKDLFVKGNVAANRLLGRTEINEVYIGREGYLIQDYQEPGSVLEDNIKYLQQFADENPGVDMTLLIAPNVNEIYPEYLPAFATTYSQATVVNQLHDSLDGRMTVVDVTDTLREHKDEELYYRTDHHWTSIGAYYAYTDLCDSLNIEPTPLEQYQRIEITEPFYGSLYSKAPLFEQTPDTVELFRNPNGEYTVLNGTEQELNNSLYDMEYVSRKDKYSIFFGGNYPLLVINSNSENDEKVLILKDSYANCMIPLLADDYGEIHMMDLRYYHEDVGEYLKEQGIQKVIFIHNIDFISTDNNFLWL